MRKAYSLKFIIIIALALTLFISQALLCDDDESAINIPYNPNYLIAGYYNYLLDSSACIRWLSYSNDHPASSSQFIHYVARQEKSPPANPV